MLLSDYLLRDSAYVYPNVLLFKSYPATMAKVYEDGPVRISTKLADSDPIGHPMSLAESNSLNFPCPHGT